MKESFFAHLASYLIGQASPLMGQSLYQLNENYQWLIDVCDHHQASNCALQIAMHHPVGFLFYVKAQYFILQKQNELGDCIQREVFNLLVIYLFAYQVIEKDQNFGKWSEMMGPRQDVSEHSWQDNVLDKDKLLKLINMPLRIQNQAQEVAYDLFLDYLAEKKENPASCSVIQSPTA